MSTPPDEMLKSFSEATATELLTHYRQSTISTPPSSYYREYRDLTYRDDSRLDAETYTNEYVNLEFNDGNFDEAERIAHEIDEEILRKVEEKSVKLKFKFGEIQFDDPKFEEVDDVPEEEAKEFIFDPKELDI